MSFTNYWTSTSTISNPQAQRTDLSFNISLLPQLIMTLLKLHFPDVCDVADEALPLQLDSHAFVLCDRSNRNLHWTTQEEEEANAEEQRLKRQDSLTSRASSKMSSAVSSTPSCCVVNLKLKCWHFSSYSSLQWNLRGDFLTCRFWFDFCITHDVFHRPQAVISQSLFLSTC